MGASHNHAHHGHDHHGHDHGTNERRMAAAAALTGLFMLTEVAGGLISGSLALLADAGHMLTDFAALTLAWFAFRLQRRPADWKRTYGFDRFQILVAFANGLTLFAIAVWILVEAGLRLAGGGSVEGGIMMVVAAAGLLVNVAAFAILHGADHNNLNVRGAALHVLGDLLGSVAALAAGGVILMTGWMPIDPLLSVVVAMIILRSGWRVVRDSGHILLEGAPDGVDPRAIAPYLEQHIAGVRRVRHVHVWSITQERPMATLEVSLDPASAPSDVVSRIKQGLAERFNIGHVTVETDHMPGDRIRGGEAA